MEAPAQKAQYAALTAVGIAPFLANGYINSYIVQWPAAYWSFEFLCWAVLPILVLGTLSRRCGLRPLHIGLNATIFGRESGGLVILMSIVLGPLLFWIYGHSLSYFSSFLPNEGLFQYSSIIPDGGASRTLLLIYIALTAGIVEEIYFRGLLFNVSTFVSNHVVLVYLAISPLLFASIHWESGLANTAASYIFGLFTAIAYVLMRNLWPLITAHVYTDYAWY